MRENIALAGGEAGLKRVIAGDGPRSGRPRKKCKVKPLGPEGRELRLTGNHAPDRPCQGHFGVQALAQRGNDGVWSIAVCCRVVDA